MLCEYAFVLIQGVGQEAASFTAGDYDLLCALAGG